MHVFTLVLTVFKHRLYLFPSRKSQGLDRPEAGMVSGGLWLRLRDCGVYKGRGVDPKGQRQLLTPGCTECVMSSGLEAVRTGHGVTAADSGRVNRRGVG